MLLVEPDPLYREVLLEALEDAGVSTLAFAQGWPALEAAGKRRPPAVVLSWALEHPDAPTLVGRLRSRHGPGLPVLALLGPGDEEADALAAGATGCLRKGGGAHRLVTSLVRALREARTRASRAV